MWPSTVAVYRPLGFWNLILSYSVYKGASVVRVCRHFASVVCK